MLINSGQALTAQLIGLPPGDYYTLRSTQDSSNVCAGPFSVQDAPWTIELEAESVLFVTTRQP